MRRLPVNSQVGLDWLNFFVANLQAAFGAFVAVYLTGAHWTQGQIGVALSIGSITGMVSQVPAGLLVDALHNKRLVANASIIAVILSCLLLGMLPQQIPVAVAEILHGLASCTLNPAIQAITLSVVASAALRAGVSVQPGALGQRFGRSASFASVGNAIASGLMGAVGFYVSPRATFFLGALMAVPGLIALQMVERPPAKEEAAPSVAAIAEGTPEPAARGSVVALLSDRRLLGFALCVITFHLANAAMLPLAAGQVTKEAGRTAELVIAGCILLPQLVGAALSPLIGRYAEVIGRRPIMLLTFAALPLRGLLLSMTADPVLVVAIQLLDGISSPAFGVMMPLVTADLTRENGRFNLCMGVLGLAMGAGASLSTTVAGFAADHYSTRIAFQALAGCGLLCVVLVALLMGETAAERAAKRGEAAPAPDAERGPGHDDRALKPSAGAD
ncbi:major facilitator superfamily transporter [Ameyamaea chiangmaiensis NBRC 103196]|uniref:MFS transporter n=1 Tax=Ameyamaea chiangmaiensis TaxID=442969 RepID=A0A850PI60_9PROT|nr:MFS transporter [Ameyamaea chiangmaiensis]MBS4075989.1 MFS transporter [Ameyamaea chiangmaiensis]NVN41926.1 MFS transporter [Ameyamaea chiangmaiensis]GBQ61525.1 major facilitator superfamily transporter [Ameyamaea chiangmaiensis NBRC 103196]